MSGECAILVVASSHGFLSASADKRDSLAIVGGFGTELRCDPRFCEDMVNRSSLISGEKYNKVRDTIASRLLSRIVFRFAPPKHN